MFDKFDVQAVKAILVAEEESRRLGHRFVDTEQLLVGLLADGNSSSARVLSNLGLSHKKVRSRVKEILGQGTEAVGVEIPFTPRMKQLLEYVSNEAVQNNAIVHTENLLAAFLRINDGVAWQILSEANISSEKLSDELRKANSQSLNLD